MKNNKHSRGAAKVSALNLDRNLDKIFKSSKQMVKYGSVRQQPYTFQDDAMARVKKVTDLTKSYCTTTQVSTKKMLFDTWKNTCTCPFWYRR